MFDALGTFFHWILMALFLLFCLVFGIFKDAFDVILTVLSEPLLLTFVLLGSVGVVLAVRQYVKYQKAYFEKHSECKL